MGFALIEAIVALAVAALSIAAFYRLEASAYRAQRLMRDTNLSLAITRTKLNEVVVRDEVEAGVTEGLYDNGYSWRMSAFPVTALSRSPDGDGAPLWIELETFDRAGHKLAHLETAKLPGTKP